jgi:hypothetical protein
MNQSSKAEARSQRGTISNLELEISEAQGEEGNWKLEIRNWKLENQSMTRSADHPMAP